MPRKKNNRKAMQDKKMAAQVKPMRVGVIAHRPNGGSGAVLALAALKELLARSPLILCEMKGSGTNDKTRRTQGTTGEGRGGVM